MWQYNNSLNNDYLEHRNHKYIERHRGKGGRWVYVYKDKKQIVRNGKDVNKNSNSYVHDTAGVDDTSVYKRFDNYKTVDGHSYDSYQTAVDLSDNTKFASQLNKEVLQMYEKSGRDFYDNHFESLTTGKSISSFTVNSRALINRGKNLLSSIFKKK